LCLMMYDNLSRVTIVGSMHKHGLCDLAPMNAPSLGNLLGSVVDEPKPRNPS
jgi:hypothetical protein